MATETSTELDEIFDGSGEPIPADPSPALDRMRARDTVNIAIAKLNARRIEGYVNGDTELVDRTTADIARAYGVLHTLRTLKAARVREVYTQYLTFCRSIPAVSAEILDRYATLLAQDEAGAR
ncbi:hypothetical protein [Marinitenerispora sediminis]|uniref:Uncharacterized protein n=1 Tax=Marinitenerispora sediminis TaxID=1931232 RepID=A0A368TBR8_9ACTN|nr:hypothetical protein [Marinitenerispora sediminis]RCV56672.1 hypothetical protein DEF28_03065 [Marinitenerispora sediminis]RCV61664.1 hypothetical protein DEF23_01775 [Marinitenerispora sediminis]RCV62604.1 hypothetical protein DEF24_00015 [Marinitenerispora sediminis]